jgi:hypothetical protein
MDTMKVRAVIEATIRFRPEDLKVIARSVGNIEEFDLASQRVIQRIAAARGFWETETATVDLNLDEIRWIEYLISDRKESAFTPAQKRTKAALIEKLKRLSSKMSRIAIEANKLS